MNSEIDSVFLLAAIVAAFFGILLLFGLIMKISEFYQELDYINMEIGRTTGGEQKYWKREKRRLWLSLLPFYRR